MKKVVYDILNAGPNQRFTIKGSDGRPMIVHNCVQYLARNVIMEQTVKVSGRYKVAMSTHDELVAIVPGYSIEDESVKEGKSWIKGVMETSPTWWSSLPLNADVKVADRYGDAK